MRHGLLGVAGRRSRRQSRSISQIRGEGEGAGRDIGCDHVLLLKIEIVLEELFLNSAHYGAVAATSPTARVKLLTEAGAVTLIYEDNGQPYDSFAAADRSVLTETGANRRVGGLGVILVDGLASTAEYSRHREWNRIVLTFRDKRA